MTCPNPLRLFPLLATALLGCATGVASRPSAPAPAPAVLPAPPTPDANPAAPAAARCGTDIQGLDDYLRPGRLLALGDPFGTNEIPEFVSLVACHAVALGHPVAVAFEIPVPEQPLLDRYLSSAGTPADRTALRAGRFWNRDYQDGRSSKAMFELVENVRRLGAKGKVRLVAIDHPALSGSERDAAMARTVLAARGQAPGEVMLVLTGNVHARTVKGAAWDAGYVPMGWLLREALKDDEVSLDASFRQGTAWVCVLQPDVKCGPRQLTAPREFSSRALRAAREGTDNTPRIFHWSAFDGYDGVYFIRQLTASGPAIWY